MREMDNEAAWSNSRKAIRQDQSNAPAAAAAPAKSGISQKF